MGEPGSDGNAVSNRLTGYENAKSEHQWVGDTDSFVAVEHRPVGSGGLLFEPAGFSLSTGVDDGSVCPHTEQAKLAEHEHTAGGGEGGTYGGGWGKLRGKAEG